MFPYKRLLHSFLTALCLLSAGGCIHTYPTPENATDPTELDLELTFIFDEDWAEISIDSRSEAAKEEKTRAENWPRRLTLNITSPSGATATINQVIEPEEMTNGSYTLHLPYPLRYENYKIAAWCDYLHPATLKPMGYDLTDLTKISDLHPHGMETEERMCLTGSLDIDLTSLPKTPGTTARENMFLSTPAARWRLIAEDYVDFLDLTASDRHNGENYYIAVRYDKTIPLCFNLLTGEPVEETADVTFTNYDLPIIPLPGIEASMASDWIFNPSLPAEHTISVSLYDSSQAVVSEINNIVFTTERGKTTTIKGRFLTNFIIGGITIDHTWAGEIIIEMD